MNRVTNKLNNLDLYGEKTQLRFKGHKSLGTPLSLVMSIFIVIIGLYFFAFYGRELIERKRPDIVTVESSDYNLSIDWDSKFLMAFGLRGESELVMENYFEITKDFDLHVELVFNENVKFFFPIKSCKAMNISDRFSLKDKASIETYQLLTSKNFYCIDFSSNKANISEFLAKQNKTSDQRFTSLNIRIDPGINCNKSSEQNISGKFTWICNEFYKKDVALEFYFAKLAIDFSDFGDPFSFYLSGYSSYVLKDMMKNIVMELESVSVVSDSGLMFEQNEERKILRLNDAKEVFKEFKNAEDPIMEVTLKLSQRKTVFYRRYLRVQEVLSKIGGLIKILLLLTRFLMMPFVRLEYNLKLVNSIFNFAINKLQYKSSNMKKSNFAKMKWSTRDIKDLLLSKLKNTLKVPENKKQISQVAKAKAQPKLDLDAMESSKNESVDPNPPNKLDLNNSIVMDSHYERVFKVNELPMELHWWEKFFFPFFSWGQLAKKKRLLKRAQTLINKKLDINFIINKLIEVDKLKILLLDENQLKLFEYLPKPLISSELKGETKTEFHRRWSILHDTHKKQNFIERAKQASEAFSMIRAKPHLNEIDAKIVAMIDPKIKELIDLRSIQISDEAIKSGKYFGEDILKVPSFKMSFSSESQQKSIDAENKESRSEWDGDPSKEHPVCHTISRFNEKINIFKFKK